MSRNARGTPPQIVDEAARWFVMMREPDVMQDDRTAFADWMRASPAHVGAYLEVARLWSDAARIDSDISAMPEVDQPTNVTQLTVHREASPRPQRSTKSYRVLLAACIAGVCILAGGIAWYANSAPTYVTHIGEQRVITLEDGSTVKVNSRSRVEVRLSAHTREISLIEGQALFEVAHDPSRPFVVRSGDVAVRAIGTQFDVNRRQSGTVVTVIEGRVSVAPIQPKSAVFVSGGEQVRVERSGKVEAPIQVNTSSATSWLQQELRFDDQPLSDVIEEFNRYSRTPLVLSDPSLGNVRINAVFHTTNSDSLLRFVSRLPGVSVERSEKEIRISRSP